MKIFNDFFKTKEKSFQKDIQRKELKQYEMNYL